MMWLEYMGANRALAAAGWLGTAIAVGSWRLPFSAIATAYRQRRRADALRIPPVSQAWLTEHEAECAKHEGLR